MEALPASSPSPAWARLADIKRAVVGCMGGSACCAQGAGHRDTVARYYRGCDHDHLESLFARDKFQSALRLCRSRPASLVTIKVASMKHFSSPARASVGQKSDSRESLQHTNRGANIFD
jgi:hypothetical protein